MTELRRHDPPPSNRNQRRGYRRELYEKLKTNPGEWHELISDDNNAWNATVANSWKRDFRFMETTTRIDYEATNRTGRERYRIWLRYVEP